MTKTAKAPKVYLARLDKIGDLVCTLGADQALSSFEVTWVVQPALEFLIVASEPSRRAIFFEKKKSWQSFRRMIREFRRERPLAVISFQAPWWFSAAAFFARVPERWGVRSQWHSFLFLNAGVRQRRSSADQHESQYNQDLVNSFLQKRGAGAQSYVQLRLRSEQATLSFPGRYVVVHPGMAGSARNWSTERYSEFITLLLRETKDLKVLITGTAPDAEFVDPLLEKFGEEPRVLSGKGRFSSAQLLSVLKGAQFVVAPSTGVLHLAAALGVANYGVYSPIRVQRAVRWRALGDRSFYLEPAVNCPAEKICLGKACLLFDCMNLMTAEKLLTNIRLNGDLA